MRACAGPTGAGPASCPARNLSRIRSGRSAWRDAVGVAFVLPSFLMVWRCRRSTFVSVGPLDAGMFYGIGAAVIGSSPGQL